MAGSIWAKLLRTCLFILLIEVWLVVGKPKVVQLNEANWKEMLEKEWMVEFVLDGEFRQYRGTRDKDAFISFVEEKKWKTIDAIPGWKAPASVQMSVVSFFFKLSQILRAVHNKLMEEYGMPTWGSYLIFAVATILVGALLGLEEDDDDIIKDDLVDEVSDTAATQSGSDTEAKGEEGSPNVRKRKARKAD
ncbi:hypothetical protein C0J52_04169 [Blattella germanica]|nr:hypothetical protein C0J52_04169 [Blattella germanica]